MLFLSPIVFILAIDKSIIYSYLYFMFTTFTFVFEEQSRRDPLKEAWSLSIACRRSWLARSSSPSACSGTAGLRKTKRTGLSLLLAHLWLVLAQCALFCLFRCISSTPLASTPQVRLLQTWLWDLYLEQLYHLLDRACITPSDWAGVIVFWDLSRSPCRLSRSSCCGMESVLGLASGFNWTSRHRNLEILLLCCVLKAQHFFVTETFGRWSTC